MSFAAPAGLNLMTLHDSKVATRLPAQDLDRARAFYAEQLGLEPVDERPGGLLYRVGSGEFALFLSTGRASGEHTQMGFEVADIEAAVAELKARGVVFEDVDAPASTRATGSPTSRATTPARTPAANAAPGFATARETCSESGSSSAETTMDSL